MGNEISTVGGAAATAACATANAVSFGKIECINNATMHCANYTGKKAQETMVWSAGETVIDGAVGTVIGAVALVTDNDDLKVAAKDKFTECANAASKLGEGVVATGNGVLNAVPLVGHVKGAIHDYYGDEEGARQAYFSANRTTGVVGGALVGSVAGPVGAVSGAIAGGAAMDGVHTGYASLKDGDYKPQGQIAAWTQVVQAKNGEEVVGGIVNGVITPVMDSMTGMAVYKSVGAKLEGKQLQAKADQLLERAEDARGVAPDGEVMKMYDQAQKMHNKAMKLQGEVAVRETLKGPAEVTVSSAETETYVFSQTQTTTPTQSKDDEDDEDEHDMKEVVLRVFYVNARSINNSEANSGKVKYVQMQIKRARPDIVAIVETWLTSRRSDEEVLSSLGLDGYKLFRKDRSDVNSAGKIRRGGGMILAFKPSCNATVVDNCKDQFMAVTFTHHFRCAKCAGTKSKTFSFGLLYRRKQPYPDQTRDAFKDDATQLWAGSITRFLAASALLSGAVLLGDFNFDITVESPDIKDLPWEIPHSTAARLFARMPIYKGFSKTLPSKYEKGLFEIIESAGLEQLVEDATHTDGNILDLIFSSDRFVRNIHNGGNINVNSATQDHCILTFELLLGHDCNKQ